MTVRLTRNQRPIPILVYHQIAKAPPKGSAFRSLYVAPEAFAQQMLWLKRLGYQGLSMSALQPYLQGELSGKVVGITFDDGYQNNLVHALPSLIKQGFSSTCYAVSGLLGQTNVWDQGVDVPQVPLMNQEEIRQWVSAGQEIGSHTRMHVDLTVTDDHGCSEEMAQGKFELESALGQPIQHFCYPYGRYQSRHIAMAGTLGFLTATTTQRGRCQTQTDMLRLQRVPVLRSTTLPVFWLKIATTYEDRRNK
jgi:peptidoglycan/xylan/chitin deacetylase (PgdA/CDA1 family)